MENAVCPKCAMKRNLFALFDNAIWCSNGEDFKHFNVFCWGTESSPCHCCSNNYNAPPKKTKDKNELVQTEGFNLAEHKGEEPP